MTVGVDASMRANRRTLLALAATLAASPAPHVSAVRPVVAPGYPGRPGHEGPALDLALSAVVVDYAAPLGQGGQRERRRGGPGACHVDVACPRGEGWELQTDAVLRITILGGRFCTGVLLNNTNADATPFVLTARHCGDLSSAVFQLDWKRRGCERGGTPEPLETIRGSELVVEDAELDFQLVRLSSQVPAGFGPYFAGWDRTGDVPASSAILHHPAGAEMKISVDDDPPSSNGPAGSDWTIRQWDAGATENGSSGGPLFSPERLVIGELSRGAASCRSPKNDMFTRMDAMWPKLAPVLDPRGSGVEKLAGLDPRVDPPPPFGLRAVEPARVPPLIPGSERTILVEGGGFTHDATLALDGEPVPPAAYAYFSNSRLALDMPQAPIGAHVLAVRLGEESYELPLEVVEATRPILQAGNGDPRNPVSRHTGLEVMLADRVGHEIDTYWSTSDAPSTLESATLGLGGGEPELIGTVTIPSEGWIAEHVAIPKQLRGETVYVQSLCRSCARMPSGPPPATEVQSVQVIF